MVEPIKRPEPTQPVRPKDVTFTALPPERRPDYAKGKRD